MHRLPLLCTEKALNTQLTVWNLQDSKLCNLLYRKHDSTGSSFHQDICFSGLVLKVCSHYLLNLLARALLVLSYVHIILWWKYSRLRMMAHGDICFKKSHHDLHLVAKGDTTSSRDFHCPFTWHGRDMQAAEEDSESLCLYSIRQHFHNFTQLQYCWHNFPALTVNGFQVHEVWMFLFLEPCRPTATAQDTN